MSNENEMTQKYQQHYNKILNGTLTDTIMKSISYQANIQLANDIIAEQEKVIGELKNNENTSKKELQDRISNLENVGKNNQSTISKLQTDLYEANKLKSEYENVKHQVQHLNTFKNDLIKSREEIKNLQIDHQKQVDELKNDYEDKIAKLTLTIESLKTPTTSKKKAVKVTKAPSVKKAPIKTIEVEEIKDGGIF